MSAHEQAVLARARDIAERRTGMPAYLVDDETWADAFAEAVETYVPPKPETPLHAAARRAQGIYTGAEVADQIEAFDRAAKGAR
jgi:hypothetical protein